MKSSTGLAELESERAAARHPRSVSLPAGLRVVVSGEGLGWTGVTVEIVEGREPEFQRVVPRAHVVRFQLHGSTRAERRLAGRLRVKVCGPGSVTLLRAGEEQENRAEGWAETLNWSVAPALLTEIAGQDAARAGPRGIELIDLFGGQDQGLWELARRMAAEIRTPGFGSEVYAEALTRQLGVELLRRYSTLNRRSTAVVPALADRRLRRAIEYIHGNLASDLSLSDLAREADLSPNHFAVAFKKAVGVPPHRYVLEARIERSKQSLADPLVSITQIACDLGFATQSHFTSSFRRAQGQTPSEFRKRMLNLR